MKRDRRRMSWMHRSGAVAKLSVAIALLAAACTAGDEVLTSEQLAELLPVRPGINVIVLSFDALRADALGAYGYTRPTSPNIDAFAEGSVVFDAAHSASPLTPISFGAAFSGKHPSRVYWQWKFREPNTLAQVFADSGYVTAGFLNNPWMERLGYGAGFSWFEKVEGPDDTMLDAAIEWIEAHREGPFFTWIHLIDPHAPYVRTPVSEHLYDLSYTGLFSDTSGLSGTGPDVKLADADLAQMRRLYDGEVFLQDTRFQRLIGRLSALGLLDRSVFVITADHGEEFMEHGHMQHGQLHAETLHIPLILHHPDLDHGVRVSDPVANIDLLPTLTALAGIAAPPGLNGRNLLQPHDGVRPIVSVIYAGPTLQAGIRYGESKLLVDCARERRKLYDLETDPTEQTDILTAHPEHARALEAALWHELGMRGCADFEKLWETGGSEPPDLDPETRSALEALGYLDDE